MGLLAAEITACAGQDPSELYSGLTEELGAPFYQRVDAPATPEQKILLRTLRPDQVAIAQLAGEPVLAVECSAPGGGGTLGGVRVRTNNGWFAARPSGTEEVFKIYAESFLGPEHLQIIQQEAQALVRGVFQTPKAERP